MGENQGSKILVGFGGLLRKLKIDQDNLASAWKFLKSNQDWEGYTTYIHEVKIEKCSKGNYYR